MMIRLFDHHETKPLKAQPIILGTLSILTLIGTFAIDIRMEDGVATWFPYSIAIVLALQWKGANTVVPVTVGALLLLMTGFLFSPSEGYHASTDRALGAATLTVLALVCLYIDWRCGRLGASMKTDRRTLSA